MKNFIKNYGKTMMVIVSIILSILAGKGYIDQKDAQIINAIGNAAIDAASQDNNGAQFETPTPAVAE